jgi:hypothetical protein
MDDDLTGLTREQLISEVRRLRDGIRSHRDWGRVLVWAPPRRLELAWQVAPSRAPEPDPSRASHVVVQFSAEGPGTRVAVEHRDFDRHGDDGAFADAADVR